MAFEDLNAKNQAACGSTTWAVCHCRGWGRLIVGFQPLHGHMTDSKLDSVVYAGVCVVV